MTKQPGLDNRHEEENGEIARKHGDMLASALRQTCEAGFTPGRSGDEKLKDLLHELDENVSHAFNPRRAQERHLTLGRP